MNTVKEMAASVSMPSQPVQKNIETSQRSNTYSTTSTTNVKWADSQATGGGLPPPPDTSINASPIPENQPSAETRALGLLKASGFKCLQQLDFVGKNDKGQWTIIEVKDKELFTPGNNFPYFGEGLDKSQLFLRSQLLEELGLRTYLLVYVKGTDDVYGAYLDELEQGEYYDTPKRIRIYPIDNFTKLEGECPLKHIKEEEF